MKVVLSVLLLVFGSIPLSAQARPELRIPGGDSLQVVKLRDGTRHIGRMTTVEADSVTFATTSATIRIASANIRNVVMAPASSLHNGEFWEPSPHTTRLFFGPTARMLPAGDGYIADHWIFFPSVNYGVTSNITIGGGMSIFPGVGSNNQLLYITPKIGLRTGANTQIAAGAIIAKMPDFDTDTNTAGILFAAGTMGGTESGITVGLGYGFVNGDFADRPMVMVGIDKRVSRRLTLVTENWVMPGVDQPLVSYGVRFLAEKLSFDFALVSPLGDDFIFPGFPLLGFAVPF